MVNYFQKNIHICHENFVLYAIFYKSFKTSVVWWSFRATVVFKLIWKIIFFRVVLLKYDL